MKASWPAANHLQTSHEALYVLDSAQKLSCSKSYLQVLRATNRTPNNLKQSSVKARSQVHQPSVAGGRTMSISSLLDATLVICTSC